MIFSNLIASIFIPLFIRPIYLLVLDTVAFSSKMFFDFMPWLWLLMKQFVTELFSFILPRRAVLCCTFQLLTTQWQDKSKVLQKNEFLFLKQFFKLYIYFNIVAKKINHVKIFNFCVETQLSCFITGHRKQCGCFFAVLSRGGTFHIRHKYNCTKYNRLEQSKKLLTVYP